MAKQRNSSIELLRIISMLFVLGIHATYMAIPLITNKDLSSDFIGSILRIVTQVITINCVNLFVMISGWFGMDFKITKTASLLFQCYFFILPISIVAFICHSPLKLENTFFLTNYWFVISYLILMICSPALNWVSQNVERSSFGKLLLLLFAIEFIYDFLFNIGLFRGGHSPWSFMVLYLLMRYIKIHKPSFSTKSKSVDILIFLAVVLLNVALLYLSVRKYGYEMKRLFYYDSPLVVVMSLYFFLFFTKTSFKSRIINWIGVSCFAPYLIHANSFVWNNYFSNYILSWHDNLSMQKEVVYSVFLIVIMFFVAILIDKVRIWSYNLIQRHMISKDNDFD